MTVTAAEGRWLAGRAAAAVAAHLAGHPGDGRLPTATGLRAVGATFVTLESAGALLGCVGTLDAGRPRFLDAMHNAVRATADPRLPPVTLAQWPGVDVIVSVLTVPEALPVTGADDVIALLRPGVDGLVLVDAQRRATFLPSVWHKLPHPGQFVGALLHKGGWAHGQLRSAPVPGDWPPDLTALRYTATEFTDPAPRPPIAG